MSTLPLSFERNHVKINSTLKIRKRGQYIRGAVKEDIHSSVFSSPKLFPVLRSSGVIPEDGN